MILIVTVKVMVMVMVILKDVVIVLVEERQNGWGMWYNAAAKLT